MKSTRRASNLPQPHSRGDASAAEMVLGRSATVRMLAQHLERVAEVDCNVLISGETGTGKEVFACRLHALGPRAQRPLVPVNCAALTVSLAESQLFGHEPGSFTGANGRAMGVFRAAEGGVVFLDEIGEMPLELQPKLLRVLQSGEVTPVGAARPQRVNVQVIAATNRDLRQEVAAGRFREDLYYRLNLIELRLPPLRERTEDIPEFVTYYCGKFARQYSRPRWEPSSEWLARFEQHPWPGNIRQLAQVIEQAYVLECEPVLPPVPKYAAAVAAAMPVVVAPQVDAPHVDDAALAGATSLNLRALRRVAIQRALHICAGHKGRAARLLGVHPNTLTRLLSRLNDPHDNDVA